LFARFEVLTALKSQLKWQVTDVSGNDASTL